MKTALVTGAARGIGLATTETFLREGMRVVMVDKDGPALQRAAAPLDNVLPVAVDIGKPAEVEALRDQVQRDIGAIDALVNNAGLADFGPIEDTTFARWRAVMETNLDGVFLMTQAFTDSLKDTRGAVVNIASISALRASTLRVAYGTSKAGVVHLTQQQAVELGEFGIRVNCVCPGP
ncbi:MAG: SDR family oxidoreductase, partial [Pseudomonadota bacterium]